LIPNPIHRVLSIFRSCEVRALLMGGQACVFYGGAEFSRDTDFAILAAAENLQRLRRALAELEAEVIAVPPLSLEHLERGHAVHFCCRHPEAVGMRVHVMAKMRGVDSFEQLWQRRTTLEAEDGTKYELLALPDLVKAKKTQRDKDWPMIRRLIEADHVACGLHPTDAQLCFWFKEARTPSLLKELATRHPELARALLPERREVLDAVLKSGQTDIEEALALEERRERLADRAYWEPLKKELEILRRVNATPPSSRGEAS